MYLDLYYLSHSATQTDSFEISLHAKSSNSQTWNGRMIHAILFAFVGDQSGSTFCGASRQSKVLALLGAIPFILKTLLQHNWLYFLRFDWTRGLLMWILCRFKANSPPEQPHFLNNVLSRWDTGSCSMIENLYTLFISEHFRFHQSLHGIGPVLSKAFRSVLCLFWTFAKGRLQACHLLWTIWRVRCSWSGSVKVHPLHLCNKWKVQKTRVVSLHEAISMKSRKTPFLAPQTISNTRGLFSCFTSHFMLSTCLY